MSYPSSLLIIQLLCAWGLFSSQPRIAYHPQGEKNQTRQTWLEKLELTMIVVVLLVASLWRVDCTAVLSNEDLIDLLRASELDHVFGAAFARNKYNGLIVVFCLTLTHANRQLPIACRAHANGCDKIRYRSVFPAPKPHPSIPSRICNHASS